MSRQLIWTEAAQRDLARLDPQIAARVVRAAVRFAETGQGGLKHLRPPLMGYRLRAGDWRLLIEIDEGTGTIRVVRVRHRREAYGTR